MNFCARRRSRAAFTLTELAIVLGIVGIILGAIWSAGSMVNNNNATQRAQSDVLHVVQNYRALFTSHGVDVADWTDITCTGVTAGYFPNDTLRPNGTNCTTGIAGTYPMTPWGGYYQVWSYQSWQGVIIGIYDMPQKACASLAATLLTGPDVIWEAINNVGNGPFSPWGAGTPWNAEQAIAACNVANGFNVIQVMLKK